MPPVVLSMTTIPSRIADINATITSLLLQARPVEDIRIYAPPSVTHLRTYSSMTVCYCGKDIGPIMKLSAVCDPAVPDNAIVITVDDDIIYKPEWLGTLLDAVDRFPDAACGFHGWNIDGSAVNFEGCPAHWRDRADVLEGFAGVAYHKAWFPDEEILNPPDFAKYVDDVWISAYLARKGIARRVVGKSPLPLIVGANTGLHNAPDFRERCATAAAKLFGTEKTTGPTRGPWFPDS